MKKHFSIQVTILVSFLLVLIIACGSIIFYNYSKTSDSFMAELEEDINQSKKTIILNTESYLTPAKVATQFVAWFSKNENNVLDAAENITLQSMKLLDLYPQISGFYTGDSQGNVLAIKRVKKDDTYPYGKKLKLPASARYEVRTINRSTGLVTEFRRYLDKNSRIVALQERPRATEYFDPRHRPWYRGAQETKKSYWSDPYIFLLSQNIGVTAATPNLSRTGKVQFVVSADITMGAISELMTRSKIGKTGITFILNQKGELVGYPGLKDLENTDKTTLPTYKDTKNPVLINAYKYHKKTGLYNFALKHDGTDYLVRLKKFGENFDKKWLIGFIVPEGELTGAVDDMTQLMMIFSGIIVLLSALFIFIISKNITAPIRKAANTMASIARFEISEEKIKDSRFSEIQQMNKALRNMKQSLRDFSKFVPKAIVMKLMTSGSGATIGGRKRHISLLFTDIKGFTSISEKMSSEKLIVHLSDYLNELTLIIQENSGTIDKYIGDAIMSFWGAPTEDPDHPLQACRTALLCKIKLEELNKTWLLDGKPPLYTRFGIHTGDAIVGNVGSEDRLNYSAFGDGVNLAARLEGINKYYGTDITISHETYKNVRHKFICRPTDVVAVKGKEEGVPIYELLLELSDDHNKKLDIEAAQAIANLTAEAFNFYLAQDWSKAIKKYQELKKLSPKDALPDLFIKRCKSFKKSPPGTNWNGIYIMKEK